MYAKSLNRPPFTRRQAGMTTLGIAILVGFVGIFVFAGMRLMPIYLNFMKVSSVVSGVQKEFDGTNATRTSIRKSIASRFDIESVGEIIAKDVKVSKVGGGHEVIATYSHKAPFIANISFVVDFDKRALIRR